LHVTGLGIDDPDYGADATSFDVDPQQSHDVVLTFHPSRVRSDPVVLHLASNDPDTPVVDVTLSGIGLAAPVASIDTASVAVQLARGKTLHGRVMLANQGGSALAFTAEARTLPQLDGPPTAGAATGGPVSPLAVPKVVLIQDFLPWFTNSDETLLL